MVEVYFNAQSDNGTLTHGWPISPSSIPIAAGRAGVLTEWVYQTTRFGGGQEDIFEVSSLIKTRAHHSRWKRC